ncbi:MAG: VWA domain-containing protein [Clostridiales bacterium]|nr:VWA domain-containing protein [Clostridiales bacterium]
MKKGLAKRILVSLLTVVMISASVLPMLVSTANVARANENVTNVLTEGVEIDTPNVVKDEMYSDYVKVTFIVNDTETIVKYVKTGDTVTVRSTNSSVGVLVGDAPNGSAVTEDTTIYVKTYNYKDVLNIKKELVNEYGEPDADGYYTLKFTAGAKNMPSIHAQAKKVVLVIDCSLSMACATDYVRGTDATTGKLEAEKIADSYDKTRWKAMYDSVSAFLNAFLPEGNTTNSVALVKYNSSAGQITGNAKDAKTITDALNGIFNEDIFNTNKSSGVTDVDKIKNSKLGSGTNVANGLEKANTILGDDKDGSSIILFTDGMANYPKAKNITSKYTYKKGDIYPYGDPAVNYTLASDMSHGFYNGETEAKDQDDEMYAAYCANAAGKELADAGVVIYSFALMNATDANSDAVRASMGDKLLTFEESELIVSSVSTSKLTLKLSSNYTFTYGAEKTGYAKEFYSTINASELEKKFQSIITSLKELPFDTATVTDKLDEHFELVPGQTGVTDNGNGTFTVTYPNKITTDAQEITVKIKAKDGYAGSSYTNAGCTFNATVGDLTYSQDFAEEPSAVITPDAVNDSYTVNQGETLTVADVSVLDNDNNIKVNNPDKNVTIKAEKVTDPQNGTITFNEDGTFTYTPNNGFSGEDTFRYKTVLTVDGRTYEKEATVTITVVPKYTQTIKYVFENDTKAAEDNVQTVVKGNSTTAVTSPSIPGYKPSIEVVEATQLTGDKEITVKYVRDDEQTKDVTYTVEYYKDNVKDDTKTQSYTNPIWVNATEQQVKLSEINTTDKFGAGYKFEKTDPATIPSTIADKGVIKVYYVADTFDYSVKYVIEGTDTELVPGYTKLATFATEVGADKKNIEGYTVLNADEKLTIGADSDSNVLVIKYRANTYGYSVEYYYDGVKDESATLNKSAQFNTKVNTYDPKEKPGYKFEKTENLPLTITTDASKNVIKVYYVKDASQTKNITYTVKYFKDGAEVTADKQTVNKTVWVNDSSELTVDKTAINTTDKYVGYKLDSAATGEIPTVVADGTVINVYYVKDELQTKEVTYTVKYFRDGVEVTADKQTVTKRIWINAPLEVEVNKTAINTTDKYVGYKLDSAATGEIPSVVASGTVINVYYVKDASQTKEVTYTIKYYKDGEEQTEDTITVTKKVWVNEPSVIDVNKADINTTDKYEGYTFDSETTGIIPNKADNGSVIKVYYKKVVVPAEPSSDNSQETVKTGDNSNMMLYILMLATCVAGAATVVVTGRKKSEQE